MSEGRAGRVPLPIALAAAVLLLGAASEIAGEFERSARAPLAVAEATIDPSTGTVAALRVTGALASARYLVSDGASAGIWRTRSAEPGGSAVLVPAVADPLTAGGGTIVLEALDGAGATHLSPPFTLPVGSGGAIRNAAFAGGFSDVVPFGWSVSGAPIVVRRREGRETVVVVEPGPLVPQTWNVAGLEQRIDPRLAHFSIALRASAACDLDATPRELSGVTLTAPTGAALTYCIAPGLRAARRRLLPGGRQVIVAVPGRLGRWERVHVDLAAGAATGIDRAAGPLTLFLGVKVNPATANDARADGVAFEDLARE